MKRRQWLLSRKQGFQAQLPGIGMDLSQPGREGSSGMGVRGTWEYGLGQANPGTAQTQVFGLWSLGAESSLALPPQVKSSFSSASTSPSELFVSLCRVWHQH